MNIMIADENNFELLSLIQNSITVTDTIKRGVYMCDCTGCSNACFETCSDGFGPTD